MTVYADYNFYTDEYLAGRSETVTEADFAFYAREASRVIDEYTFGNIDPDDVSEEVRLCCCELAEAGFKAEHSEAAKKDGIASESVTGWSQSYERSESRREASRRAQRDIIRKWLSGTGLLYSGVR